MTLTLDRAVMRTEDAAVPLLPGMAVTVEIKTGTRRILSYLFSPDPPGDRDGVQGAVTGDTQRCPRRPSLECVSTGVTSGEG